MNTEKTYYENLTELAQDIKECYLDPHNTEELSEVVYECVDNALIYYSAQYYVMDNTRNEDACFDHMGDKLEGDSYQNIVGQLAYFALIEDLQEYIEYNRWESAKEYLQQRAERVV